MIFVVFTGWYQRRTLGLGRYIHKHSSPSVGDYSVCITNLPHDLTSGERT
jgi:hypothetical protein